MDCLTQPYMLKERLLSPFEPIDLNQFIVDSAPSPYKLKQWPGLITCPLLAILVTCAMLMTYKMCSMSFSNALIHTWSLCRTCISIFSHRFPQCDPHDVSLFPLTGFHNLSAFPSQDKIKQYSFLRALNVFHEQAKSCTSWLKAFPCKPLVNPQGLITVWPLHQQSEKEVSGDQSIPFRLTS